MYTLTQDDIDNIKNDDLDKFITIYKENDITNNLFKEINNILKNTEAGKDKIFNFLRKENIDWFNLTNQMQKTDDYFYNISNYHVPLLFELTEGKLNNWFKDKLLCQVSDNLNVTQMRFLLKNGADIELKSLNTTPLLLRRNIRANPFKVFANSNETRKLIEIYWPHKTPENQIWSDSMDNYLDIKKSQPESIYNLSEMVASGYIIPEEKYKKNYNIIYKAATFLSQDDYAKVLDNWKEKNLLSEKAITTLYKYITLNANNELLKTMQEKNINPEKFVKSKAFNNILDSGSLLKGVEPRFQPQIKNMAKQIKNYYMFITFENTLSEPEKNKKLKLNKI